jgi:hypothetical protein
VAPRAFRALYRLDACFGVGEPWRRYNVGDRERALSSVGTTIGASPRR